MMKVVVTLFLSLAATAVGQTEGDLRQTNGYLEIYHVGTSGAGAWKGVCDDGFSGADAAVVCRQLGHTISFVPSFTSSISDISGTTSFWFDDVNCDGTETRLDACNRLCNDSVTMGNGANCWADGFGVGHNCFSSEYVLVNCTTEAHTCYSYSSSNLPVLVPTSPAFCAENAARTSTPCIETCQHGAKCYDGYENFFMFGSSYVGGCASTCTTDGYTYGSLTMSSMPQINCCDGADCNGNATAYATSGATPSTNVIAPLTVAVLFAACSALLKF